MTAYFIDEKEEKKHVYPCIMRSAKSPLVVLFSSYGIGTVVKGIIEHPIGEYLDGWKMESFALITKPLVLEND